MHYTAAEPLMIVSPKIADAIAALEILGFRKPQATAAVAAAARSTGEDADIATLIRLGLKGLARKSPALAGTKIDRGLGIRRCP